MLVLFNPTMYEWNYNLRARLVDGFIKGACENHIVPKGINPLYPLQMNPFDHSGSTMVIFSITNYIELNKIQEENCVRVRLVEEFIIGACENHIVPKGMNPLYPPQINPFDHSGSTMVIFSITNYIELNKIQEEKCVRARLVEGFIKGACENHIVPKGMNPFYLPQINPFDHSGFTLDLFNAELEQMPSQQENTKRRRRKENGVGNDHVVVDFD
ncbi:hypothetical protein Fot_32512 [Forsythia ovata]|uniref:Uncharacterized protein n=1 Tax=Forsythia ovata TaxID=205694 RepID=A0ABD1T8F0_9LAMI